MGTQPSLTKVRGVYHAVVKTPQGIRRRISLGTRNREEALTIASQATIKEIEAAAKVSDLRSTAIGIMAHGRRLTIEGVIPEWELWMKSISKSPSTIYTSRLTVEKWANEMGIMKEQPIKITEAEIAPFINNDKDTTAGTRVVKLAAIRSFFRFCASRAYSVGDPAALVQVDRSMLSHIQKESVSREPFTDAELMRLLRATEGFWHAAIIIGRYTGLRLGDIANLEWSSLNKDGTMTVWTDKRDRRVNLPVSEPILRQCIENLEPQHPRYVFPDQQQTNSCQTTRAALSKAFSRICLRQGIEGKSFHCLRHSYATECLANGVPMPHIQMSMGHTSMRTTEGYVHSRK